MATYTNKNAQLAVTNSATAGYTAPASTTAVVTGCTVANITTTAATLTVTWTDSSNGNAAITVLKTASIPPNSSIVVFGGAQGKLTLETGDALKFLAAANSTLEASITVVEISA